MKENIFNNPFRSAVFKSSFFMVFFAICCLIVIPGCKAKKQLVVKKAVIDTVGTNTKAEDFKTIKINAIKAAQTVFNTFSGRARTKLDINGNSNDVTLNIHIKHDKKIWVSITAIAGIEVARALITPDSILIINRLQGLYLKKPFSYVNTFAGNQFNYKTLESLLIGNAIPELITDSADLQITNSNVILTGDLSGIIYKVMIGPEMKAAQTNLSNQSEGQSLQVVNSVFIQSGNKVMPSQIDMSSIVKDKKILVNLHYVKEEFDQPLEFPFTIPSRYNPGE